ncbi:hypothetical protein V5N11_034388 [Cardamine amara subsp. amara]|uniref:DUF4283 domain-containing protein n=1 Tax=Cardamine amara subsp. amara TaxID=228776 RepID=A0ABD1C491_CARAN
MERRIPYSQKGKEVARGYSHPPRKRIRAPDLDNSDLIQENALTLIGRLTNPEEQRLWSLIPFLSNRWNLKGKAIGSDLGRGCFRFRFDFEKDIQKVLDNMPYHFDQWMVILQRWEPIISESFPNQIPFWIELKGIPLHYWKLRMVKDIGEELGQLVEHELTPTIAKIKVIINCLNAVTKKTMIDFPNGSEALVTMEYKSLKKHCSYCQRLSHEVTHCPGKQKSKEELKAPPSPPRYREQSNHIFSSNYPRRDDRGSYKTDNHPPAMAPRTHSGTSLGKMSYDDRENRERYHSERRNNRSRIAAHERPPYRPHPPYREESRRDQRDNMPHKERYNRQETFSNLQWREKTHPWNSVGQEESEGSRTRRPPLERILDLESVPSHREGHTAESLTGANPPGHGVIIPSTEEVIGELREITVQYTSYADPTESAARKHRVVQGETRGLMAETAANIIAAAKRSFDQANSGNIEIPQERGAITLPEPPSRVSALDRITEPIAP